MNTTYKALALALGIATVACAQQGTIDGTNGPLAIEQHDGSVLTGSFDAGDMYVLFYAEMPHEYVGVVEVTVRGKTLAMTVDAYSGAIEFDAANAELAVDEVAALHSFSLAIDDYLGPVADTAVMHESLLAHAGRYFAVAPARTPLLHVEKHVVGLSGIDTYSRGNDGKRCIDKGDTETAKFDGDHGDTNESWVVGSDGGNQWNGDYECMGRCGEGCGSYDWTLDCLDHDACSRYYYSSTGAFDHNCGDEWSHASDDYTNFWKRCRG